MAKVAKKNKIVTTLTHEAASRKNIPTAEFESVVPAEQQSPIRIAYDRRNRDLDPQLVWRGKDGRSAVRVPAGQPSARQWAGHPAVRAALRAS